MAFSETPDFASEVVTYESEHFVQAQLAHALLKLNDLLD
jgi:hypothetical protein